ncbi:hypothetical protein [Desulfosarcina ovata]|uniref:Terminase small subunit n=1 Tax=Desulfosarcina ovata subsp. ovata TaxID=2752305 RepID=A0A5K8AH95_9BACT|nr:hypothetical protein [Desulfosarcina ovata]BBO92063.1 hypothetical protein DSCOOX_52430 [Desulfosarcina ovata subsp. ovata]
MNLTEYAKHRQCTKSMISQHIKAGKLDGAFTKNGGRYVIDVVKADQILDGNQPSKSLTLNEAKTAKERALAELREMEVKEKRGELIPASDVEVVLTKLISAAKVRILGIKSKVAPLLAEAITDVETRDRVLSTIDRETRGALQELSNAK